MEKKSSSQRRRHYTSHKRLALASICVASTGLVGFEGLNSRFSNHAARETSILTASTPTHAYEARKPKSQEGGRCPVGPTRLVGGLPWSCSRREASSPIRTHRHSWQVP
eukprot:1157778-Pelagomonas_calceolata.AAC.5